MKTNEEINRATQGWHYEEHRVASVRSPETVGGDRVRDDVIVRVTIYVDTSYREQSFAWLEVFDTRRLKWNTLAALHPNDIPSEVGAYNALRTTNVAIAVTQLREIAAALYAKGELFGIVTEEPKG